MMECNNTTSMSTGAITDSIAYRVSIADIERDGDQISVGEGPDTNSLNDENYVLTLLWNINDDMSLQVRANDRVSDRIIGSANLNYRRLRF